MHLNKDFAEIPEGKRIYLASDFHLTELPIEREKVVIEWLDKIKGDAAGIFLVGDLFDFWFEYKHVVPKGTIRFLGKLAELSDMGIPLIVFTGNHDLWLKDYMSTQFDVKVITQPTGFLFNNKKVFISHGDGLGPGSHKYKLAKKIFLNPMCRWAFRWLHPDLGVPLARYCSHLSKVSDRNEDNSFQNTDEALFQYCQRKQKEQHFDYYVFGHRHLPIDMDLAGGSKYLNLGEWIQERSFGIFHREKLELHRFRNGQLVKFKE